MEEKTITLKELKAYIGIASFYIAVDFIEKILRGGYCDENSKGDD